MRYMMSDDMSQMKKKLLVLTPNLRRLATIEGLVQLNLDFTLNPSNLPFL